MAQHTHGTMSSRISNPKQVWTFSVAARSHPDQCKGAFTHSRAAALTQRVCERTLRQYSTAQNHF